jgi:hypothetical protein
MERMVRNAALVWLAVAGVARADLVLTIETKDLQSKTPATRVNKVMLAGDKLATQSDASGYSMIWRSDKKRLYTLDPKSKSYMEFDQVTLQQMTQQMNAMFEQMKGKMADMPPEQRAMMEKMMQPKAGAEGGPKLEVKSTGEKSTIEGKPCTKSDLWIEGERVSEIWATSWSEAKASKEDFAPMRDMAAFLESAMQSNPFLQRMVSGLDWGGVDQIDGFPVLVRQLEGTTVVRESKFTGERSKAIDAAMFEVPAGWTRQELGAPAGK